MGFWKSLFGLEDKNKSNKKEQKSEFDTTFVTYDEEKNFEDSIYGSLQLFDADVSYISEVLPDRGENLQKQIEILMELLEKTNNEDDPEVRKVFEKLKKQFEEDKKLADGEYTISELENQNKIMDETFEKTVYSGGITKSKLEEYISFIGRVQKKVSENEAMGKPLLTKVQKQKFNSISMKSEYRIKMLELMFLSNNCYDIQVNPFKDISPTKQKIFSKLFFEDAQRAAKQYEMLSLLEEEFNKYNSNYFTYIDNMVKELNFQMANVRMIDDFSITQLFDSSNQDSKSIEFLERFVRFKKTLNEMESKKSEISKELEKAKQKQEEIEAEERKKQEELEKLKSYTDADIKKEIYRIEHDLTSKGSRFVNILDFQKKVAIAKGLLDTQENLNKDGIFYKAVDVVTAWEIIKKANTLGISYAAFPDCQENRDGGITFAVPESEKGIFNVNREQVKIPSPPYNWRISEELGEYPGFIINRLDDMLGEDDTLRNTISVACGNGICYKLSVGYNNNRGIDAGFNDRRDKVYKFLDEIKNDMDSVGKSAEELQDVMCYITVPATRNIIPILEEFKNAGVSSYIEPVPKTNKRNENNRNNIQIYFERDDLEKFRDDIFDKISNPIVGIATLVWDDKSIGNAIKDEINWPKSRQMEEK